MVLRSDVRGAGLALRSWAAVAFLSCAVLIGANSAFADVWVDDDWSNQVAGAVVDGHTIGTDAFATIQAGIDAVDSNGQVFVWSGKYSENLYIDGKPVALHALEGASSTILSGVVTVSVSPLDLAIVDGLTLAVDHPSVVLNITQGRIVVSNCTISAVFENSRFNVGRGMTVSASDAVIRNNTFLVVGLVPPTDPPVPGQSYFCSALRCIGGTSMIAMNVSGDALPRNWVIENNLIQSTLDIGLSDSASNHTVDVQNNVVLYGSLILHGAGPQNVLLRNNTFVRAGIGIAAGSSPAWIANNIITEASIGIEDHTGSCTIWNNDLWGNGVDYVGIPSQLGVNGNILRNPRFVDRLNIDLHLDNLSACIGAGATNFAVASDSDDNQRPSPPSSAPDIGAYENSRELPLPSPRQLFGRYEMVLIADSDDFPELGNYPPIAMNNAGQVVIGTGQSILVGDGKTIHRINVAASAISINDSGVVACAGTVAGTTGIYVAEGTNITAIAVQGDTFADFGWPSINNAGAVAFSAAPLSGWRGIYLADNTGTHLLYPPTTELYYDLLPRSLNNAGTIAFWAIPQVAYPRWQELLVGNGGAPQRVAKRGGDGIIGFGFSCSLNDAGQVVFPVTQAHDHAALYLGAAGQSPTLVASEGGPFISDGVAIVASINNGGEIAFYSELKSMQEGVFTGKDIQRDTVIHDDVVLFGSTVSGIRYFGGQNFNDAGQVALPISFYDGRFVVVRADPLLPENLSIVSLKAPKRLKIGGTTTSRAGLVKVVLQNDGGFEGTIPDLTGLTNLVTTVVESLGDCPSLEVTLDPIPAFPIRWLTRKKIRLTYRVEFDCMNDPLPSAHGSSEHADYRVKVHVNSPATDREVVVDVIGN